MTRDTPTGFAGNVRDAIGAAKANAEHKNGVIAARQFTEADTNPKRAAALLIIPHGLLLRDDVQHAIIKAAMEHSLWVACHYVDAIASAASAVRTASGHLPDHIAAQLEGKRAILHSLAQATGDQEHTIKATYEAKFGMRDTILHQQSEAYRTAWDVTIHANTPAETTP